MRFFLPSTAVVTRLASAASIGVLLVILALMATGSRDAAFREAEIEVRDSARSLVAHMLRVLEVGDLLLLHQQNVASTIDRRDGASVAAASRSLQRMVETAPFVFRLFMVDARGDVYASSMTEAQPLNTQGRDYFQFHQAGERGLHISSVLRSQATGDAIVILSRRVTGPGGEFAGVVLVSFQLDTLRNISQTMLPERWTADFQIISPGMQVIVDGASPPDHTGRYLSEQSRALFEESDAAVWTYEATGDAPRLWAHQRVHRYPLYVRVGITTAEINARWLRSIAPSAALSLLILAVLAGLSTLGIRHAHAAEIARRELDAANRELEGRVQLRTAELRQSNEAVHESEARLQLILDAARLGTYERDLRSNAGHMSARGLALHGLSSDREKYTVESFIDTVHPLDRAAIQAALARALSGQGPYDVEYRVTLADGQVRWIGARGEVIFDAAGAPRRVAGISYDITERKRAEQRLKLLAREVDHRARNLLAVVQAMVRMTRAGTIEEFIDAVEGRISALGRAHTLLAESRWTGADLRRIVNRELAAFKGGVLDSRVQATGPTVMLNPAAAQSIAMAVHELATNAMKYGALAVPEGRVRLDWSWTEDGSLALGWTESGGPAVQPPARAGFGTRVINGTIQKQLRGQVDIDWRTDGLRCRFVLPAAAIAEMPAEELETAHGA